jgi:hypothetical protein
MMGEIVRDDETANGMPDVPEDWGLRELRNTALHAAIQINAARGDYQEVIRSAREIFSFLKDG